MTDHEIRLARARHVMTHLWLLALQATRGWHAVDHVVFNGLAMAWKDCECVLGLS